MVKLVDAFYYNNQVYLFMVDLITDEVLLRSHALKKEQTSCDFELYDVASFLHYLKERTLQREKINHKNHDDLLELDTE